MDTYFRNTNFQFRLIWTLGIVLIIVSVMLLVNNLTTLAIVTIALFIGISIIKINGLTISNKSIAVQRYSFFGFRKEDIIVNSEQFNLLELWERDNLNYAESTDSWLDIFYLPAMFLAGKKGLTIGVSNRTSNSSKAKVCLNEMEYQILNSLLKIKRSS
jgi:hypothetical protein